MRARPMRWALLALVLLCFAAVLVRADDAEADNEPVVDQQADDDSAKADLKVKAEPKPVFKPTTLTAPFLEQFTDDWKSRWVISKAKKVIDGVEDEDLLAFRGQWAVEEPSESHIQGDKGLVVKTAAAHHAISAVFDKPIDPTGKPLVVQYEVKLQNGLECGGAYLKLLTANDSFVAEKFNDKTPYTIMFGPDKCGYNNKVHFIFRHKNPVSGEYEEKHFTTHPSAKADKNTNLYTLIVKPDNSFDILINSESVKKGSLLEDFTPAVNPPAEIDDPEDKKPEDWVEEAKIQDPDAKKPDDWDEDAPFEIEDADAKKPDDWLDDEPSLIADPEAKKPEDWDDEEDGEWVPPQIANPKCEKASGCGEWKRPFKKNPDYKGKWKAPLIDNPDYKGEWKPRKIKNPTFFEDKQPSNFNPIGAIGFELWTMQDQILFDNIYVGHSPTDAKKLAAESWKIKFAAEEKKNKAEQKEEEKKKAEEAKKNKKPFYEEWVNRVTRFYNVWQKSPMGAIQSDPTIAGALVSVAMLAVLAVIVVVTLPSAVKKEEAAEKAAKEKAKAEKEDEKSEEKKEEKPKKEGVKKRNPKTADKDDE